ncbi:hypothetical protein Ahy_B08g091561 [Arachis hypogaea]|uniref:Aminotransferase-like plant mobile domain-containing protein n=1 Tax=Arachis hypogaea TaxID=3818 RepID=A0A444Y295_ARAHY|nr:hypothetical protein Ahy_B08g091561 [Arachis hypogaea]
MALGRRFCICYTLDSIILDQPQTQRGLTYYNLGGWLPLLEDFARYHNLSWGSAVLAWTYHSLCPVAHRSTTDIVGCTPLLVLWIYHRFSQ